MGKNAKSTKHRKTREFLAGGRGRGRRQGARPLSPTERRETPSAMPRPGARGFCRHAHPTGGRRQGAQPLSPTERIELPYGKDTARRPLAGIKGLRPLPPTPGSFAWGACRSCECKRPWFTSRSFSNEAFACLEMLEDAQAMICYGHVWCSSEMLRALLENHCSLEG